jgi:hypothetical protein
MPATALTARVSPHSAVKRSATGLVERARKICLDDITALVIVIR